MSFEETMREWRRMCDYETRDGETCGKCPLKNSEMCGYIWEMDLDNVQQMRLLIEQWSKKHRYPTWGELLVKYGVIAGFAPSTPINLVENLCKQIPADVAKKLDIQPKEYFDEDHIS